MDPPPESPSEQQASASTPPPAPPLFSRAILSQPRGTGNTASAGLQCSAPSSRGVALLQGRLDA